MASVIDNPNIVKKEYIKEKNGLWIDRWPFLKRFGSLRQEFEEWSPTFKDIKTNECPSRGFFQDEFPNTGTRLNHTSLIDSHAQRCGRDAASGLISAHASPHRPWHRIETPDQELNKYPPVKVWLDDTNDRMMKISSASNIYDMFFSMFEELIHFGVASGIVTEDYWTTIRGRSFTCGEYYLGLGPDCRVDTFARWYWMTVGQLVRQFGYDRCSQATKADYDNHSLENWKRVIHLIEVNDNRVSLYSDFRNMPYRSIQWEDGSSFDNYLRIGGYEEFPILSPRWATRATSETYSNAAPGWIALGDSKMLQKLQREKLLALAKVVNPPMQKDASIQGEVNTLPGGITTYSSMAPNAGLKPAYQIQPDLNAIREDILEVKRAISDAYSSDLFKMMIDINRTGVTATEIAEKKAEKLAMLAPFVEKVNDEMLTPYITRLFNIGLRNGLFMPPPKELQGMDLKIVYISIFAQAQRMIGINAIEQWKLSVYQDAQAFGQDALDIINLDEKNQVTADMLGVPAKVVNSAEKMMAKRKARAEQLANQERMAQAAAMAEAAQKGSAAVKNMAQSPMDEENALQSALGALSGNR